MRKRRVCVQYTFKMVSSLGEKRKMAIAERRHMFLFLLFVCLFFSLYFIRKGQSVPRGRVPSICLQYVVYDIYIKAYLFF